MRTSLRMRAHSRAASSECSVLRILSSISDAYQRASFSFRLNTSTSSRLRTRSISWHISRGLTLGSPESKKVIPAPSRLTSSKVCWARFVPLRFKFQLKTQTTSALFNSRRSLAESESNPKSATEPTSPIMTFTMRPSRSNSRATVSAILPSDFTCEMSTEPPKKCFNRTSPS